MNISDVNIELGVLKDNLVGLFCDKPLPDVVKRVEYYMEQRLFMLVYKDDHDDLMEYQLPPHMNASLKNAPEIIIYMLFGENDSLGYKVPLIKVHN